MTSKTFDHQDQPSALTALKVLGFVICLGLLVLSWGILERIRSGPRPPCRWNGS